MPKCIVHIDLNCFFVQCEILQDPSLKGKPVAIGRENSRGVISTASYEARKLGISSGMAVSIAKRKAPSLILIDGHYSLYKKYSQLFFSFLRERYPILEQASIDECYIDMGDFIEEGKENDYLFDLRMLLYRKTSLKCSIGCSKNKFLAKMASDMKKPLGLTILDENNIPSLLWPLSIDSFFGIGKKTAPKLKEAGILSIGDLAVCQDDKVKEILGSLFSFYKAEANGIADDFVDASSFDPKSISAERTFLNDEENYEEIASMIYSCCKDVCDELKRYHKKTLCVVLKWRTPDFVTKSRRMSLKEESDEVSLLYKTALAIFDEIYKGQKIRLIGVGAERVVKAKKEKEDKEKILKNLNDSLKDSNLVYLSELKHESE